MIRLASDTKRASPGKRLGAAIVLFAMLAVTGAAGAPAVGTPYANPIMWADVPDPSLTRAGDTFYLISTTMHLMPGAPVMRSKDLVHWELASYVFDRLTDTPKYDLEGGTVYGRGQWASSIRYHQGKFYVLFSPNDAPFRTYIYSTTDPTGKWDLVSRTQHFHDASLFFDDDGRVYVFSGTGSLTELESDLSAAKPDFTVQILTRDAEETGLLEGSQAFKHDGKYYLLMISWPRNGKRRQLCYRADTITGPYEKKVIIEADFAGFPYIGQGALIDSPGGAWHGVIFQDRGGVGRVPLLLPVRWVDGWPMLGDEHGRVPATGVVPFAPYQAVNHLVESDDFAGPRLKPQWQWNHNPIADAWSLQERPGYLRLKTSRIVDHLYAAPNTLTQRMEGPQCRGVVALDLSGMRDGDIAGLAAFNGDSGVLAVRNDGGKKTLTLSSQALSMDRDKAITRVDVAEAARIELSGDLVYLRVDGDFNLGRDIATFHYSTDNREWKRLGTDIKMRFDYRRLFMGTKFALFNYATKTRGGFVDADFFAYQRLAPAATAP